MTPKDRIVPIQQKLWQWWRERSERERRILAVWVAVVVALSLWFGAYAPLMQRIAVLERRVPELEMLLNRMRMQPSAGADTATAAARQTGEDLRSVLYSQLAERSISAELRALSSARVEMRLPEMPMREALDVLDFLRRQTGARVAVFGARSDGSPGGPVRIVVELERDS
jgi:type II secretory pathway component PulM